MYRAEKATARLRFVDEGKSRSKKCWLSVGLTKGRKYRDAASYLAGCAKREAMCGKIEEITPILE
jgi:hypothetical protein